MKADMEGGREPGMETEKERNIRQVEDRTFQAVEKHGALDVITTFAPTRHGARPVRRITKKSAISSTPAYRETGFAVDKALELLNKTRIRGTKRLNEAAFRSRLAKALSRTEPSTSVNTFPVIDSLVERGTLEREERFDRQGNVKVSYLSVTPQGNTHLDRLFGPIAEDSFRELELYISTFLRNCQRPIIASFLERQAELARRGGPVALNRDEDSDISYFSMASSPNYVRIIDFFGFVGSQPESQILEFKEISGRLNPTQRDSVKFLENLRADIMQVAESELGVTLEELGIKGTRLLYWIPFHGDLKPEGHALWGTVPALSTRDIRKVAYFDSGSRLLCLVENRTVLDVLAEGEVSGMGWTVICTEGMPKTALYGLLSRIRRLKEMKILIWTDWDLGGLRICEKLFEWFDKANGITPVIVPHPRLRGRQIEIPPRFKSHANEPLCQMARDIYECGAVYQEESLSIYEPEILEVLVTA